MRRLDWIREEPEIDLFAANVYLRQPALPVFPPIDTKESGGRTRRMCSIGGILGACAKTQIRPSIIRSVSVDMVNFKAIRALHYDAVHIGGSLAIIALDVSSAVRVPPIRAKPLIVRIVN
jgi:hypothetical protein